MQIRSSLITTLRISPAQGVRRGLLLIPSKKLLTPLRVIVTGVKKGLEGLLAKYGGVGKKFLAPHFRASLWWLSIAHIRPRLDPTGA